MHFRHRQTDRWADGLASWHKREMYILHLALKLTNVGEQNGGRDDDGDCQYDRIHVGDDSDVSLSLTLCPSLTR